MILSSIMWSMWSIGMHLAQIGLTYATFAGLAYWRFFQGAPAPLPLPRKPPDPTKPTGKARLTLLALQVALRMAADIPDITLQHDVELRHLIRHHTRRGILNIMKLSASQRDRVFEVVNHMPEQLLQSGDVCTVIADTGASSSVTGYKDDFVPGSLKRLTSPILYDGIAGSQLATHIGLARYETFDDNGNLAVLEHETQYVAGMNCRLLSPQSYFTWIRHNGGGENKNSGINYNRSSKCRLETYHDHSTLHLPGGKAITFPHCKVTRLPLIHCFKDAIKTSQSLALSCVSEELNQNLTHLQKCLLQWHFRLGHMGFQWLQWLGRKGVLGPMGERMGKRNVEAPKCAACQFGKQQRNPKPGGKMIRDEQGILKKDKLKPGELIFSDQYESRLPGRVFNSRGSTVHTQQMIGGTLFCDAASGRISVHNQVSLSASDTIASKLKFEREAMSVGVQVDSYCTDNGIYTSQEFLDELGKQDQTIRLSGVGGHHQNGVSENAIKNVVRTTRTMMIHAALRWPEQADKKLWPLALQHAVFLYNHTPRQDSGLCPEEIWSGTKNSYSRLLHAHPWGCPVYVLDPRLQDGHKLPKWEPQSRHAQYVGYSPLHASTVGLVRNLKTGNLSPQFHLVFDDWFETVHATANEEPKQWQELIQFHQSSTDFDEDQYVPELSKEWLNQEEIEERDQRDRRRQEQGQRNSANPPEDDPNRPQREPRSPQREHESPSVPTGAPETPTARETEIAAPGRPQEEELTPGPTRPQRNRKQTEIFTQNEKCGYKSKVDPRRVQAQSKATQYNLTTVATWTRHMIAVTVH